MITDEEIDNLSDDPDIAFIQYEAVCRNVVRASNSDRNYQGWDVEREYVTHILAFVDVRNIAMALPNQPPGDNGAFSEWYADFLQAVDYHKARIRLQTSLRRRSNGSVLTLTLDMKTQVGGHLTAIRKIVREADLGDAKRDAILRRVNGLQEEVDRDRTRTEAMTALVLEVTSAIGKGAKNLDPVLDRVERLWKILAKARDDNAQDALVSPSETKRLEPPKSTPPSVVRGSDLDDEIPF